MISLVGCYSLTGRCTPKESVSQPRLARTHESHHVKIAHSETTDWTPPRTVRGGFLRFKCLLEGQEGSPNNFSLVVVHTDLSFKSPRHRHNFDQIRITLQGSTNIGPRQNIEVGDVAYFPEGAYYGPQNQELVGQSSLAMVIQFGGVSGNGYMSQRQMLAAQEAMQAAGRFEDGVYRREGAVAGERKNQDAYEAIWEHHNGRPIHYPKPQLSEPVQFPGQDPDWNPVEGAAGVSQRLLGDFTAHDVRIATLRLEPGASHTIPAIGQARLVFFTEGAGAIGPEARWAAHTAAHIEPHESVTLTAHDTSEALVLTMPGFDGAQQ